MQHPRISLSLALIVVMGATPAHADPPCGAVEFRFQPGAHGLQIAVWVEDANGKVVDTPYITRATGIFGIANRPGAALLKTDCGWPYGRREMVLPIWAHHRDHHYPKVVMGGECGNSPSAVCPNGGGNCGGDCDDSTIAYHGRVSSPEPYFCAPLGCTANNPPDVITCASMIRTLSKGAYLDKTMQQGYSLYPPRADLNTYDSARDSPDLLDFPKQNDLVAVSQATPKPGAPISPPLYWNPKALPPGDYVAWIELSQEADFNANHRYANQDDTQATWNNQGHPFLGQPSIVYNVRFHYDANGAVAMTSQYAGYGAYDGADGKLHPADSTISDTPGSGAGRLVDITEGADHYRFKVLVGACSGQMGDGGVPDCNANAPPPVEHLALAPTATGIGVTFDAPSGGETPSRYNVRYRMGDTPITAADFDSAISGGDVPANGTTLAASIASLMPETIYTVAVRSVSACGASSLVTSATTKTTALKYAVLHGCFVATAAYGTPLAAKVDELRRFRDAHLLDNALGRLGVAIYYAFSPAMARAIANDTRARAIVRGVLEPVVELVERVQ